MEFKQQYAAYQQAIEEYLNGIFTADKPYGRLQEAMRYSILGGGKRIRPVLTLEFARLGGIDWHLALPYACALELVHNYSLIHDDLPCMDDDDLRRGQPTTHKKFGETLAVLAGDALQPAAYELILERVPGTRERLACALLLAEASGPDGMVAGQVADLASEKSGARDMDTLRFIHVNKTGAMIRASLLAGGCVAGADEEQLKALSDFGYAYGDLFQMTDDILDVEGSFESMGKTLGKDAQEGKLTYISLVGLEEAKKIAGQTAENALAALEIFGEKAWLLRELTNATLSRKS